MHCAWAIEVPGRPTVHVREPACELRLVAGLIEPDFRSSSVSICAFRQRFLKELQALFVQILVIARELGSLQMGTVSLDGTRIKANASKHKALSWKYANALEQQLKQEVEELIRLADTVDNSELPEALAIPEELKRREARCRGCIGCRLDRARDWSIRCTHEAQMHDANSFVTLTYDDEHLPPNGSLDHGDPQRFLKRLRKRLDQKIRYMLSGEYGDQFERPHYHLCIFGYRPDELVQIGTNKLGQRLYASPELEALWPYGHSSVGEVTPQSANYTARYCVKKITGERAEDHYAGRTPDYGTMSLKPGLGYTWFLKYWRDVYPHDYCVVGGKKFPPPEYYDKLLEQRDPAMLERVKRRRILRATEHSEDETPERRHDRYVVKKAAISRLKNTIQ